MLDGIEKGAIGKNLTKQELENYLNRVDKEKEFFGFARMLSAQFSSIQMKKHNTLRPLVKVKEKRALKARKQGRLTEQRRQLCTEGTYSRPV